MQPTHFRVLKNISGAPNGGAGFNVGETHPVAAFTGCDLAWLQTQGAIIGTGPEPTPVMASINGATQPVPLTPSGAVNFGTAAEAFQRPADPRPLAAELRTVDNSAQWDELKAELAADNFKNLQAFALEAAKQALETSATFKEWVEGVRQEILAAVEGMMVDRRELTNLREELAVYRTRCESSAPRTQSIPQAKPPQPDDEVGQTISEHLAPDAAHQPPVAAAGDATPPDTAPPKTRKSR